MGVGVFYISGGNVFSVSQHGVAVRDGKNLGHLVRDEDKRFPLCFQFTKNAEKVVDFIVGKSRGWLVKDQELRVHIEGAANFQELFFTGFEL